MPKAAPITNEEDGIITVTSVESGGYLFKISPENYESTGDVTRLNYGSSSTWHTDEEIRAIRDALTTWLSRRGDGEFIEDGIISVDEVRFEFK